MDAPAQPDARVRLQWKMTTLEKEGAGFVATFDTPEGEQPTLNPRPTPSPSPSPNTNPDPNPDPDPNQASSACARAPWSRPRRRTRLATR